MSTATTPPIVREDDATPFVRAITTALRRSAGTPAGIELLSTLPAVVGVRSASDFQRATIVSGASEIRVHRGLATDMDLIVDVDPATRRLVGSQDDVEPAAAAIAAVLQPELPELPDVAAEFWELTKNLPGMPALKFVATDSGDQVLVGDSARPYEIHGAAADLRRILGGLETFPDSLFAGKLTIIGTFREWSVVTGASMKAVYDV
ncbi:hypothetical protein KUG88_23450 [Rhodococcus rhodochrous]|uniref:hypothetical protein n=1 Tax=Rhodococcus rhodochrous TaxID=1829 RepID=UPI001E339ADA|nr:hypothetical protein [Rhodococcus rhodochrous]MCB8913088.1 hypothetical protein [Rhodococcus rhodochrous]